MIDPALPIAFALLLVELLRLLVFAYLWWLDRAEHLWWWTLAFGTFVVSQFAVLVVLGVADLPFFGFLGLFGVVVATMFKARGTFALVGWPVPVVVLLVAAVGAIGSSAVLFSLGFGLTTAAIGPMGVMAVAYFLMAGALVVGSRQRRGLGLWLSSAMLFASGVHFADFPFVGDVDWFVPYGFALQLVASVGIALGFALLHVERARAAEARTELRYAALADGLGVGVFQVGRDGSFREGNRALATLLGCDGPADLVGLNVGRDIAVDPAAWASLLGRVERSDEARGVHQVWRAADGRSVEVELSARAVRDSEGTLQGYRGFVLDRTLARAIEERLREGQKLEAVGQLAAGVAHDFNNLLTILQATIGMVQATDLTADQRRLLADADEATDQAARLTGRLLAFGRRQPAVPRIVDVGASVRGCMAMARSVFGDAHRLDLRGVAEGLHARIDPVQLEQVVLNLALNARDALPAGGSITIRVVAKARSGVAGVVLLVADEGMGIPADLRPRIFEPFFTTKEVGRGTGLGLATVHGIVVGAGGTIEVDSEVGSGTTVRVWLPAVAAEGGAGAVGDSGGGLSEAGFGEEGSFEVGSGESSVGDSGGGPGDSGVPGAAGEGLAAEGRDARGPPVDGEAPRALVADDEPVVRRLVARLLREAGYIVDEATSGNEVAALHREGARYAVVVSDVRMPDGDGVVAARAVRELAPSTRIVLMSGYTAEVDASDRALCDAFLAKPFDRASLMQAVGDGSEAPG